MGVLSDMAKAKYKSEEVQPRFELRVAGRLVERVRSISGTFAKEAGSSGMAVEADFPLHRYEEEFVTLRLGYGEKMVEYFRGKLFEPDVHPITGNSTCEVYGPYKAMQQSFGRDVDFSGDTAAEFFVQLGRESRQGARFLEVQGGFDVTVEEGAFVKETELIEAAKNVAEKLDFVMLDRPGWRRLVMPTPAPGARAKSIARYDEGDYPPDGFKPVPQQTLKYSRVNVFRRADDGTYPVDEWATIAHRGRVHPPENRIFYVPEYPGTKRQGANTAARKARMLSRGMFKWSLEGIYINPEILLFDTVTCLRTQLHDGKPHLELYACMIDSQINFEITNQRFHMNLAGETAVLSNRVPLELLEADPGGRSPAGVVFVPPPPLADYGFDSEGVWINAGELEYMDIDGEGWWIDEALAGAGGKAGFDMEGVWLEDM